MATDISVEAPPVSRVAAALPWRKLLSGGTAIMLGSAASNVLSFLFTLVVARLLRPEAYATVTACLSLLVVATVPSATLQLVAARYTAIWWQSERARAERLTRWLAILALAIGTILGLTVVLLSAPLKDYLHLATSLPLLLSACILLGSFLGPVYRGLLQGQHHFGRYAVATSSEYLIRLTCGVVFVVAGWRELGALGGVLCGLIGSAGLAWWFGHARAGKPGSVSIPWASVARWTLPTLFVQAALAALLFQDTLLAKHFFSPASAGAYAGLATTARVLVYISGALSTILFPVVARTHSTGGQSRLITHMTLGLVVAIQAVLLIAYTVAPRVVMHFVVGDQYSAVSHYLPALAVALTAYSIVSILVSYLLATANRIFWVPLLAAPVVQVLLMSAFHQSLAEFITAFDVVMLAALAILLVIYLWPSRRGFVREEIA